MTILVFQDDNSVIFFPRENSLDEAGADSAEEVFGVGLGLGQDFGLVAVFEGDFLEEKFDGVFGLEALGNQFADAGGEAVGVVGGAEARKMVGTFVVFEFGGGEAIVGGFGGGIVQQRRERVIPFALGTGPAVERVVGGPDEFSGGAVWLSAVIEAAVHERRETPDFTCVAHEFPEGMIVLEGGDGG